MELRKILIIPVFLVSIGCSASNGNKPTLACSQESEEVIQGKDNNGIEVVAKACGKNEESGSVHIETFVAGKLIQKMDVPYDTPAFSLDMENNIDLNSDGIPDLSLNTGSGKGGEGVFYWIMEADNGKYYAIGDYPALSVCDGNNEILYSIIPGSGESISTWKYFKFNDQKLDPLITVNVIPGDAANSLRLIKSSLQEEGMQPELDIKSNISDTEVENYLQNICRHMR